MTPSFKMGVVTGFTLAMITVADTREFEGIGQKNGGKLPEEVPSEADLKDCMDRETKVLAGVSENQNRTVKGRCRYVL